MGGTHSTLKPEVVNDLKNHTAFSYAEICDIYRQYREDCAHKDHYDMTLEDFTQMYLKVFPQGDAHAFAANVFKTFDHDDTGRINFRQFISMLSIQLKGNLQQKLEWAFDLYDIEKTGYISKKEVGEMITSMSKLNAHILPAEDRISCQQLTDYIFERADVAKDGRLSKREFLQAAMTSKTIQKIIEGTTTAASSPYTARKERSGSFGKPRSNSFRQRTDSHDSQ